MSSNYAQHAIDALYAEITEKGEDLSDEDSVLALLYATLVLIKGTDTTYEDVHDTWAVWAARFEPWRQSIVPFAELPDWVRAYDRPYVEAIHRAAAKTADRAG